MHYAERELFRYTKGSVREHNLLKNQFVHTKFLLNRYCNSFCLSLLFYVIARKGMPQGTNSQRFLFKCGTVIPKYVILWQKRVF